jgi:hypothetical protein
VVLPSPHIAEFATVGSVQGSGEHENVGGVSTAAVHVSADVPAEMVYPAAHPGAHDAPDATVPPAPHDAEFATVGNAQASGEHDGGMPLHVPDASHVYPAPLPTAVNPAPHTTPTVQVDPTATMFGPHVPSLTVVEFKTVTPGPALHTQYPAVPVHDPSAMHVHVAGVPPGVSPGPHVVVTEQPAPTATALLPHAATPYVAPPPAAIVNPEVQAQTGAVPLHVPAVA